MFVSVHLLSVHVTHSVFSLVSDPASIALTLTLTRLKLKQFFL